MADVSHEAPPMFGDPRLVPVRLGQGTFRALITDNYQWRPAAEKLRAGGSAPGFPVGSFPPALPFVSG